jgi:hypothetical protein
VLDASRAGVEVGAGAGTTVEVKARTIAIRDKRAGMESSPHEKPIG